jgi:uncharacterized protein involved in outer membrane biogenesis
LRRKILIAAGAVVGVLMVAVIGLLLYLKFGDLTRHGGMVGNIVTDSLGREFKIEGRLELAIGFASIVVAEDVTLANPDWSVDPAMFHADRVEATVDLFSLFSDTIRIHDLEATGASLALEVDAQGRASWDFPTDEADEDDEPLLLEIAHARVDGFDFSYRDEGLGDPIEAEFDRVEIHADDAWKLDVELEGRFREAPLIVTGKLSSLNDWMAAEAVEHDLRGSLGEAEFATKGTIEQLAALEGVDLTVDASGPSLALMGTVAGVEGLPEDSFGVSGRVLWSGFPCTLESFVVRLGDDTVSIDGALGAPPEMLDTDFTFEASGLDIAPRAALAGVEVPSSSFRVAGRIVRRDKGIGIENLEGRIGGTDLRVHGIVGDPPEYDDSDLEFRAAGPDLSVFGDLAGIQLPRESFEVEGRVEGAGTAVALEGVRARLGGNRVTVDGTVDPDEGFVDTDLRLTARGPDLAAVAAIAGVEGVPHEPFRVAGGVRVLEKGYELRKVEAKVGDVTARAHGRLGPLPEIAGTDLGIHVDGPDLSWVGALAGIDGLPAEPFRVDGGAAALKSGYRLREVEAGVGDVTLKAHGRVGPLPEIAGTDLDIHVDGPDLSWVGALAGRDDLPAEPFRVDAGAAVLESGYELREIDAQVGTLTLNAAGRVGPVPDLDGTTLRFEVRLPKLSAVGSYLERTLPEEPVAVRGSVSVEGEVFHLEDFDIGLGRHHLGAEGALVPGGEFIGTDLAFEIAIPDISEITRFVAEAGIEVPIELTPEVVGVSGRVSVHEEGYRLHDVDLRIRRETAYLDGLVGHPPDFVGTDLTFEAQGPDGALVNVLTEYEAPAQPIRIAGRVEKLEEGIRLHNASVRYGEYLAEANGTLGEPPKLVGTNLDLHAEGPSLELIGNIAGYPDLPDEPFDVTGRFEGTPTQFSMPRLEARLGPSDLNGSFAVDLQDKPDVRARFHSRVLDLGVGREEARQAAGEANEQTAGNEDVQPAEPEKKEKKKRVISDEPFDLDVLGRADIDLRWTIDELALPLSRLRDFDLGIHLDTGGIVIDPLAASVESGGDVAGSLTLNPSGDSYRMRAGLKIEDYRFDLSSQESDPATWTPFDIDLDLDATGRSPHEIASTLSGNLLVAVGEGRLDNSLVDLVVADFLLTILESLNPFRKEEPFTRLECGVFSVKFTDGVADLKPLVLRTDKMTMTGAGKIRFETEKLDLAWATKPRKGIGLSASALTNSYIKLGGTLANPSIEMKPLEAVTTTGVAVATAGLSVLGRGLWDRITAERNVCLRAVKKMEKQERKEQKKAAE